MDYESCIASVFVSASSLVTSTVVCGQSTDSTVAATIMPTFVTSPTLCTDFEGLTGTYGFSNTIWWGARGWTAAGAA